MSHVSFWAQTLSRWDMLEAEAVQGTKDGNKVGY